jgi:regulator of protease activity HflC (stomatin/prohibitin superfamily)
VIKENEFKPASGWLGLFLFLIVFLGGIPFIGLLSVLLEPNPFVPVVVILCMVAALISARGLTIVQPNQARVLLLFGKYKGTVKTSGYYWVNPFFNKKKISLRIQNFETGSILTPERKDASGISTIPKSRSGGKPSKVNDRDGNPIEISAVVVWRVVDTAEALFEVDNYEDYVSVQSESALRNLATRHPYDSEDHEISLRGNTENISKELRNDIQERLDKAGVEVIEARISHLAYAPEIAAAMLQRQQAQAVVAARTKIVEGAVGMVEMALDTLSAKEIIQLDDERRAAMVSNLLVVLCSGGHTQPVVNTGTLYQ